jgi:hypothetical protein
MVVDGKGVPLGITLDAANRHDMKMSYGYAVGSVSPCVLYGLRAMDLLHDAILYDNARLLGHGNLAMARR